MVSLTGRFRLGLTTVGMSEIRRLNRRFRGIDKATDVLSFGYGKRDAWAVTVNSERDLGDVVICPPVLSREAKAHGRSVGDEFALAFVHGTLHLAGFDHVSPSQEKTMFRLQQDILMKSGRW